MIKLRQLRKEQERKAAEANASVDCDGGDRKEEKSKVNAAAVKKFTRNNAAQLRCQKDISEISSIPGVSLIFENKNDLMNFKMKITPSEGLYSSATFTFSIVIPGTYPYDPPKVHCDTLVYHPNIDWEGHVCLNILRQDWMPVLNIDSVIFGLLSLFLEPNGEDPLNKSAAQEMILHPDLFKRNVKSTLRGCYMFGKSFPNLLRK